jgi:hypothetical protein
MNLVRAPSRHGDLVVLTLACAVQFMVVLDVSVVNVALPSIRAGLGFGATDLHWVVNGYALVFAGAVAAAAGFLWQSTISEGSGYLSGILGPAIVISAGTGLLITPITATVTSGVPECDAGAASGLMNTAKQVGGALGLAALTTVVGGAWPHRGRTRRRLSDGVPDHRCPSRSRRRRGASAPVSRRTKALTGGCRTTQRRRIGRYTPGLITGRPSSPTGRRRLSALDRNRR